MKRQARKVTKRVFSLLLVIFLLGINSFAAVVSDNDGSAFITKAEFDSLKNNFQSQIDQYNQSIDSKIDGAIASYLSGIKLDEGKRYRVFGADQGIYQGIKINGFYTIAGSQYLFCDSSGMSGTSSRPAFYARMLSQNRTNRGYGFALWVYDFVNKENSTYNVTGLADGTYAFVIGKNYPTITPGSGEDWQYYLKAVISTTDLPSTYATKININTSPNKINDVCSVGVSDLFKTPLSVYRPYFPLYEFLDAGEATVKVAVIGNGSEYEAGIHGGRDATSNPAKCKPHFFFEHNGTQTQVTTDSSLTYDGVLHSITLDVKPGDRLGIQNTYDYEMYTNTYSIFYYQNDIPGWDRE